VYDCPAAAVKETLVLTMWRLRLLRPAAAAPVVQTMEVALMVVTLQAVVPILTTWSSAVAANQVPVTVTD
jgi:hypothetical protein